MQIEAEEVLPCCKNEAPSIEKKSLDSFVVFLFKKRKQHRSLRKNVLRKNQKKLNSPRLATLNDAAAPLIMMAD